jgi:hypothetical protein
MVRRTIAGGAIVLLIVLLVLGIRGCLDARKERALRDYASDVNELSVASAQQSEAFFTLLREGGQTPVEIEQQINGFRSEAEQLVERAKDLDVPDEMETANRYFVDVLEFRRDGLAEIGEAIPTALGDEGRSEATARVAAQMLQFLASDVIMIQRVFPNLRRPLEEEDLLAQVTLPSGEQASFLPDTDWLDPDTVADRISRIRGGGGGDGEVAPGLHGTGITGVTVQPTGATIQPGGAVELPASENLSLQVSVQNQGEHEERDVVVRVTISGAGEPLRFEETIDTIAAGATEQVSIPIAETPPAGRPVEIEIVAERVPGEENLDNNSVTARAIFSG